MIGFALVLAPLVAYSPEPANGTTVFLCNQTGQPIIAQYELTAGKPLTLSEALQAKSGCLAVSIPGYSGTITFTGTYGSRHFTKKTLTATPSTPVYITFSLSACPRTTAANRACLQLI